MPHPAAGYNSWDALYWILLWTIVLGSSLYLPLLLCKGWPEVDLEEPNTKAT